MTYSITYDADAGIIVIVIKEAIDQPLARKVASAVARLAQEHNCFLVLNDVREATTTASIAELYDLPHIVSEMLTASGVQAQKLRRAIVVPDAMNDFVFFEAISRYHGQNVMLFRDIDEARRWLLGQ